jgi:hypothetical protein
VAAVRLHQARRRFLLAVATGNPALIRKSAPRSENSPAALNRTRDDAGGWPASALPLP